MAGRSPESESSEAILSKKRKFIYNKIGLDKINPFFYDYIILGIDEIEGRFNKVLNCGMIFYIVSEFRNSEVRI